MAGHFKAKTLFEATRHTEDGGDDDDGPGGSEKPKRKESVDLPPGDSTEDLMWLRKWLDKEDERQVRRKRFIWLVVGEKAAFGWSHS